MRDILVVAIVIFGALVALRRPWIGVMLWAWISLMNPHRYCWGFAVDAPLGMMAALSTLIGFLFAKDERDSPFKGAPAVMLGIWMLWITLSWQMGKDPEGDYPQWDKVMKIDLMVIVALCLLRTKQHVIAFVWVCALSLGLLGAKGGLFTVMTGGGHRVLGPAGSFIGDNNAFALALIMTIPLLRFLQMQLSGKWARHGMTLAMLLVAAAALGSHSRGALVAIAAMTLLLWWRGNKRFGAGVVILVAGLVMLAFMPENWTSRMSTINDAEQDTSVQGRFSAWWVAWRLAFDYPFGVGFHASRPELFIQYSPYGLSIGTPTAHSIYFQALGHHGFVGLFIFLGIFVTTWYTCWRIKREVRDIPQARWCADLAAMCQVSLIGYATGGAFLSLIYFDLPYNVMVMAVLARAWVRTRAWEREPVYKPGWRTLPGLATLPVAVSAPAPAPLSPSGRPAKAP